MLTTLPALILRLRDATLNARRRNNGKNIGTEVSSGLMRVVHVTYDDNGASTVTPLSGWMSQDKIVDFVNAL